MIEEKIKELLQESESEYLDFKCQWHTDKASLLHDIICLANSYSMNHRYIIFGIDDNKKIIGVDSDQNRMKDHDFQDWFSKLHLNHQIRAKIQSCTIDRKILDCIEILNLPLKPFYIKEDFQFKKQNKNGKKVRKFHIYSRQNSKNTPIDSQIDEDSIKLMWREQFGLDLTPIQRFQNYLEDIKNWKFSNEDRRQYFYVPFPEFRLIEDDGEFLAANDIPINDRWFDISWNIGGGRILKTSYALTYHKLNLGKTVQVWWGDNGREPIPLPEIHTKDSEFQWSLSRESINYKVGKVIAFCTGMNLDLLLQTKKISID